MSDGISREDAVPETMPGRNGGVLLRGGGRRVGTGYTNVQKWLQDRMWADGPQDRQGILNVLHAQALKGNIRAIELCLWYGIGKPTETVDLTLRVREAATRLAQEMGIDDSKVQGEVDALVGR
jgi:hypothetical protein